MPFCSSGVSGQIPGTTDDVILTTTALEALAAKLPGGWLTAPAIAGVSSLIQLHLPSFCAADPPADPGMTAADVLALITMTPTATPTGAIAKLVQLLERLAWPQFCQCLTATTPAVTPPSAPSGLPAINPPQYLPAPAAATPCQTYPQFTTPAMTTVDSNIWNLLTGGHNTSVPPIGFTNIPGGTTTVEIKATNNVVGGTNKSISFFIIAQGPTGVSLGSGQTIAIASGATVDAFYTVPAGAASVDATIFTAGGAPLTTNTLTFQAFAWCGALPGQGQSACCPPDPSLQAILTQILTLVTLTQRQGVPFAYVPGTVHAGLTGTGTVAVSGILALAAQATTLPTQLGQVAGTPPRVFELGWLSLGTADGYEQPVFLDAQNQLIVPRSAGLVTTVGYSLHSGVTLTLTELLREP